MYINYTIYSACGPRLFLFTQCDAGEPRFWTPMIDVQGQISICSKNGSHRLYESEIDQNYCKVCKNI